MVTTLTVLESRYDDLVTIQLHIAHQQREQITEDGDDA